MKSQWYGVVVSLCMGCTHVVFAQTASVWVCPGNYFTSDALEAWQLSGCKPVGVSRFSVVPVETGRALTGSSGSGVDLPVTAQQASIVPHGLMDLFRQGMSRIANPILGTGWDDE